MHFKDNQYRGSGNGNTKTFTSYYLEYFQTVSNFHSLNNIRI